MLLFILIHGVRTVHWVDEEGERQDCPCCGARASVFPAKRYVCYHLYFVPLVPLHILKFVKCRACRARFLSKPDDERHAHMKKLRMVPTTAAFSGNSWYTWNKQEAAAKRRERAAAEAAAGKRSAAQQAQPQPQPQRWLYLAALPQRMPQRPKTA
ncbi:zinc-ribbon domain-containing [Chlorella sorokiniana]|uniref:Zinc-ribbon domain-containing n=1 Tax=Chlorella sorokiniana TaxID=3076 RepID=A0A2P6TRK5_CHLSO|nr:zinc-ribbon domain-containing [Chlorella sorokiniana]|eukprot:PRW56697.1 zinc-ribbon domain-containing [Chlorella sorokiniana]